MNNKAERLRTARVSAGFASASAAARTLGISIPTYSAHENGNRSYSTEDAAFYAKRFGVSVQWLLTGDDAGVSAGSGSEGMYVGMPVVGSVSMSGWEERPPVDLTAPVNEHLHVAMLMGRDSDVWFAVTVGNHSSFEGAIEGDYLLCRVADSAAKGERVVVERIGFDGKLRQLRIAQCLEVGGGESKFVSGADVISDMPRDQWRVLGRVEALYRSLL